MSAVIAYQADRTTFGGQAPGTKGSAMKRAICAALAATLLAAPAVAAQDAPKWDDLRSDQQLTDGLVVVAAGGRIYRGCPTISPRRIQGIMFLMDLKSRAASYGYSDAEIRAFVDDPAEKARIEAIADAWLASRGTAKGDEAGLCRVGREEIAANTQIGRLLRND